LFQTPEARRAQAKAVVEIFSAQSLRRTDNFASFLAAIQSRFGSDLCYEHSPEERVRIPSFSLIRNVNYFGSDNAKFGPQFKDGFFTMRQIVSLMLRDAVYSPRSTTIAKPGLGLYEDSVKNLFPEGLGRLATLDPLYYIDEQGQCRFGDEIDRLEYSDQIAISICGTGYNNYGHFLYDGLPAVLMLVSMLEGVRPCLVGPSALATWQRDILEALNLLPLHWSLSTPVKFRTLLTSSQISYHVPFPTRFVRPVFDMLRFRFGGARQQGRKLFVSRSSDATRRLLMNRAEVEVLFAEAGFEIVHPEQLSVADQARLFASAEIVAGESGAGFANVGFCDPGAKVFEIQPENFFEGWTRAACMLFGHRWFVFSASAATDADDQAATRTEKPRRFTVDVALLKSAIEIVVSS
jgi:hypothetical protein